MRKLYFNKTLMFLFITIICLLLSGCDLQNYYIKNQDSEEILNPINGIDSEPIVEPEPVVEPKPIIEPVFPIVIDPDFLPAIAEYKLNWINLDKSWYNLFNIPGFKLTKIEERHSGVIGYKFINFDNIPETFKQSMINIFAEKYLGNNIINKLNDYTFLVVDRLEPSSAVKVSEYTTRMNKNNFELTVTYNNDECGDDAFFSYIDLIAIPQERMEILCKDYPFNILDQYVRDYPCTTETFTVNGSAYGVKDLYSNVIMEDNYILINNSIDYTYYYKRLSGLERQMPKIYDVSVYSYLCIKRSAPSSKYVKATYEVHKISSEELVLSISYSKNNYNINDMSVIVDCYDFIDIPTYPKLNENFKLHIIY